MKFIRDEDVTWGSRGAAVAVFLIVLAFVIYKVLVLFGEIYA